MLIELCALGSLSDVLHEPLLRLSPADKVHLALGCCEGVAALHALNDTIVHRDIKSMNFLVDGQLNAKLADLELGQEESGAVQLPLGEGEEGGEQRPDYLLNWMPPEVGKLKAFRGGGWWVQLAWVAELETGQSGAACVRGVRVYGLCNACCCVWNS